MSCIKTYIEELNMQKRKALSIFLTAGFPKKNNFIDLAKSVLDSGSDLLELGIPFSDPLADGHVIQAASKLALEDGVTSKDVLDYSEQISKYSPKPVILMGYANPIKKYGIETFLRDAANAGVKGLIVPDVPLEEYDSFFNTSSGQNLDECSRAGRIPEIILLTTPTSSEDRIRKIDSISSGFVYCVSITGTTGVKDNFDDSVIANLKRTYSLLEKNKMMIGFGISKPEDVKRFSPFCDGVIVGSRIMKSLLNNEERKETLNVIKQLSLSCG